MWEGRLEARRSKWGPEGEEERREVGSTKGAEVTTNAEAPAWAALVNCSSALWAQAWCPPCPEPQAPVGAASWGPGQASDSFLNGFSQIRQFYPSPQLFVPPRHSSGFWH